jgi:hypothetical protein
VEDQENANYLLLELRHAWHDSAVLFANIGRPNLDTTLEATQNAGCPKRECHCARLSLSRAEVIKVFIK